MVGHTWAQYSSCLSDEINRKQCRLQKMHALMTGKSWQSFGTASNMAYGAKDVQTRSGRVNDAEPSLAAVTGRVVDLVIERHRPKDPVGYDV
jgi:hypothetical protein